MTRAIIKIAFVFCHATAVLKLEKSGDRKSLNTSGVPD
jgi:hypothetical protein